LRHLGQQLRNSVGVRGSFVSVTRR
jgi:hypothetical protein